MLTLNQKIKYLENQLDNTPLNYADSFKSDIYIFIDDFNVENELLNFLNEFLSKKEIDTWISNLTSRIVLKFDEENESINDFIYDYIENG